MKLLESVDLETVKKQWRAYGPIARWPLYMVDGCLIGTEDGETPEDALTALDELRATPAGWSFDEFIAAIARIELPQFFTMTTVFFDPEDVEITGVLLGNVVYDRWNGCIVATLN